MTFLKGVNKEYTDVFNNSLNQIVSPQLRGSGTMILNLGCALESPGRLIKTASAKVPSWPNEVRVSASALWTFWAG